MAPAPEAAGRPGPRFPRGAGWRWTAAAALLCLAVGAGTVLALRQPSGPPAASPATPGKARSGTPARTDSPASTRPADPPDRTLLVWTPGRLPDGTTRRVRRVRGVQAVTVVKGGLLELAGSVDSDGRPVDRPRPGATIPLEAIGFDPASYPAFQATPARAGLAELGPGEALLGTTSARLRRLGPGGRLRLALGAGRRGERWLTVAGVVDDTVVGAAEVAVNLAEARATGITADRYLLLGYRGSRAAVAAGVRRALPPGLPVRLRGPSETPFFRAGDAVLPQAMVKERFGEFSWRPGAGGTFVQDQGWAAARLATARVPILGRVRCNRTLLPALAGAMGELRRRNLGRLVDPETYAGCWNPRLTRGGSGISRHAWGAALDLDVGNPSAVDPRLVEIMARWGFTWGGRWLVPDPIHFEWLGPP